MNKNQNTFQSFVYNIGNYKNAKYDGCQIYSDFKLKCTWSILTMSTPDKDPRRDYRSGGIPLEG